MVDIVDYIKPACSIVMKKKTNIGVTGMRQFQIFDYVILIQLRVVYFLKFNSIINFINMYKHSVCFHFIELKWKQNTVNVVRMHRKLFINP